MRSDTPTAEAHRQLVEGSADGLLVLDVQGRVRYANQAAAAMFGAEDGDLLGWPFGLPPNDGQATQVELVREGLARAAEIRAVPSAWDGHPVTLASVRDVTERSRAEQEARLLTELAVAVTEADDVDAALETVLRLVCESAAWPYAEVWLPAENGQHLELGPACYARDDSLRGFRRASQDLTFAPGDGLPGRAWVSGQAVWNPDLYNEEGIRRAPAAREAGLTGVMAVPALAGGEVIAVLCFFEAGRRHQDQPLFRILTTVAAQLGAFLARRRAEDRLAELANELAARNDELERSNTDLEQFAAMASHDLMQPLMVITGYAQTLRMAYGDRLDEQGLQIIDRTLGATERMAALIDGFLAYCRVATEEMQPEPFDCAELVDEVLRTLSVPADAEIRAEGLPTIVGDRALLGQVFQNLLANALKFASPGALPRIDVEGHPLPDAWLLSVSDNGQGVPPEQRATIFDMYRQGRKEAGGAGIGLAICRKVVESHGGRIWVEEAPGGGSCFLFTIPHASG